LPAAGFWTVIGIFLDLRKSFREIRPLANARYLTVQIGVSGRATAKAERLMLKHDIDTKSLRGDNPTGIAICTDCGELATPMLFRFADPRF